MENIQNQGEDPKEEKLVELVEDEVRNKIVEDYGLDEIEQSDLIDKLVQDKLDNHKKLSTAIRQKIEWRDKAKEGEGKPKDEPKPKTEPFQVSDIDKILNEKLEARDLESLDLSDELKREIQTYAKLNNVSVKKALESDYIQFQKGKAEKETKVDDASLSGTRKSSTTKKDYSQIDPSRIDLRTPEGKAEMAEYEKWLRS